ncbi:MAG: hypothetical protein ACTSPB_01315 [Candidatus Thorarchaeota archaeon]
MVNPKVEVFFKKSRRIHDKTFSMIDVRIEKEGQEPVENLVDLIQIEGNAYPPLHIDCYRNGWYRFWNIKDASFVGSVLVVTPKGAS